MFFHTGRVGDRRSGGSVKHAPAGRSAWAQEESTKTCSKPRQVAWCSGTDGQNQYLGCLVRVLLKDELFECGEFALAGFKNEQDFVSPFQFSLPPVVRFDPRQEVCAGGGFCFENSSGETSGGLEVGSGDEDYGKTVCDFHGRR